MLFYFVFVVPSEYALLFLILAREVASYFRRPCEKKYPSRVCSYQFLSLVRLHFALSKCVLNVFSLRIKVLLKIIQQVERLIKMLPIRYTHSFGKVEVEEA